MCDVVRRRMKLEAARLRGSNREIAESLDRASSLVENERDADLVLRALGLTPWSASFDRVMGLRDDADDPPPGELCACPPMPEGSRLPLARGGHLVATAPGRRPPFVTVAKVAGLPVDPSTSTPLLAVCMVCGLPRP